MIFCNFAIIKTITAMKTIRVFVIIGLVLFTQAFSYAYDFISEGLAYNILKDGTLSVTYKNPKVENTNADGGYSGDIVIPAKVTYKNHVYNVSEIGYKAFYNCGNIKSLEIPEGIKRIDFLGIGPNTLESIFIPASVSELIPGFAYQNKYLKSIIVSTNNKHYTSYNNCIYNKRKTRLIMVAPTIRKYTFPPTVNIVEDFAFSCVSLDKLTIPKTVTTIGGCAFSYIDRINIIDNKTSLKKLPGSKDYRIHEPLPFWAIQPSVFGSE